VSGVNGTVQGSNDFWRKGRNPNELSHTQPRADLPAPSPWGFRTYDDSGRRFAKNCNGIGSGAF
jgi:hypothetical protein